MSRASPTIPWSSRLASRLILPMLLSCQPSSVLQIREPADLSLQTPIAAVSVALPEVDGEIPRQPERLGLITVLLEAGLAELDGVVPVVGAHPPAPGLDQALMARAERWRLSTVVSGDAETLTVALTLCDPDDLCIEDAEPLSAVAPYEGVARLLQRAAAVMDRPLPVETVADMARRPSPDDYALLLAGRAAATFYGLLPPAEAVGVSRKDPLARAALVDPAMADVWWLIARRASALGEPDAAAEALGRGLAGAPERLAIRAAAARLSGRAGVTWADLDRPDDRRFPIPHALALLAEGQAEAAAALARRLADLAPDDPAVVALQVAVADARGGAADDLLLRWQEAAPEDPAPVRRRIQARLDDHAYAEARGLLSTLRARIPDPGEADRLAMALDAAVGDLERAAQAADRLELPDTAAQLRARLASRQDPAAVPDLPGTPAEVAAVVTGQAQLAGGDVDGAAEAAAAALALRPRWPPALALRLAVLEETGQPTEDARAALYSADPDWDRPRTAPGRTGAGVQSQPPSL